MNLKMIHNKKSIKLLKEVPAKCWNIVPHDASGIQFFSKFRKGLSSHHVMLDGGSAINSTIEELKAKVAGASANDDVVCWNGID